MSAVAHTSVPRLLTVLIGAACLTPASLLAQTPAPVGPEFRVNSYTTGAQRRPAAKGFMDGFVVTWQSDGQDGDQDGIFAQQYNWFGGPTGPEFRVNSYTASRQHAVASDAVGPNMVFAWQSEGQDGDLGGVFAQRWSGAPLGGEFRVNTFTTSSQVAPAVAVGGGGGFVVVWASLGQDGSGSGIFAQRYASTGVPVGPEFRVNTYTTGFQGNPSVGMETSGHFTVVWEGEGADDQPFGIYFQRYDPSGAPIGGEFRVNSFTTGDQRYPRVDAGVPSGFTVVWQSDGQDGSGHGVYVGSFPDFRVNTFTTGSQSRPAVHSRWYGNTVITWQSDDNQDPQGGVFGQFSYGSTGSIGSELRANTYTPATQDEPVVTLGGQYVVFAWSSQQDPDGSRGIYAQRWQAPWLPVELQDFTVE